MMHNPEHAADLYSSVRLSKQRQHEMFEDYAKRIMPYCHGNLNQEFADTGKSFRIKDNSIKLNSTHHSVSLHKTKSRNQQMLDGLLAPDERRQSQQTKSLIKSLHDHSDALQRSDGLVSNIAKLHEKKLLANKQLPLVKFPGIIRHEHIYNDYHARETNPGYSRNKLGGFYTS